MRFWNRGAHAVPILEEPLMTRAHTTIEVPMICDDRDPPRYVITYPGKLSQAHRDHLVAAWADAMNREGPSCVVLEDGMQIHLLPGQRLWPDAEFYAA